MSPRRAPKPKTWIGTGQGWDAGVGRWVYVSVEVEAGCRTAAVCASIDAVHAETKRRGLRDSIAYPESVRAGHFVRICACGRGHELARFLGLPPVGVQIVDPDDGEPPDVLHLRNCPCGSTLAVEVGTYDPELRRRALAVQRTGGDGAAVVLRAASGASGGG